VLADAARDPAFGAEALALPSESYVGEQMAVVDPDARWTLQRDAVLSSAGYSIYEGWPLTGRVVHTLVRGRFVLRDGALQEAGIGTGRYVRRRLDEAG
jgi:hypothetical protein